MSDVTRHIPVLEAEVLEALRAAGGGAFLDCTLGGAGHSEAILKSNLKNSVVASDRDLRAIERARVRLAGYEGRFELLHSDFAGLAAKLSGRTFDGLLADLGISTDQLKEGRGFSFTDEQSFDMRMDESAGSTAADLVNDSDEQTLIRVLHQGGIGPEARKLAQAIIAARPHTSAKSFASVVNKVMASVAGGKYAKKKVNPATVVFQALRIAVNREFEQIDSLMEMAPTLVRSGGRMAVITFHSLEDKAVVRKMREWESGGEFSALNPASVRGKRLGKIINKKGVEPSAAEVERNPSARSACLRVFEFMSSEGRSY